MSNLAPRLLILSALLLPAQFAAAQAPTDTPSVEQLSDAPSPAEATSTPDEATAATNLDSLFGEWVVGPVATVLFFRSRAFR